MADAAAVETPQRETTPSIYDLLRAKYAAPEWAFMEEVAPATGGGTRYADGVAMNLWHSRGHAVLGFEVKVSRSDWLRELKQPEKADPVMRYCDHWWVVAERGCVMGGELPINWGLMERHGAGLRIVTPAPKLEAKPLKREFFASLMRRGFELLDRRAAATWANKADALRKRYEEEKALAIKSATRDATSLREAVSGFEAATGIAISQYTDPIPMVNLAKRLHRLQGYGSGGSGGALCGIESMAAELERAAATVRKALAEAGLASDAESVATKQQDDSHG